MSYWLEDKDGKYLGDLASNLGLAQLRERGGALQEFIEAGQADENLVERVVQQASKDRKTQYVADLLEDVVAPVFVTDGNGEESS